MLATPLTLYWLKQPAGKFTLPRHPCDTASSAMLDFVVYLLYRAGSVIASALPLRFLFALGQFLGFCAWLLSGKYRRLAECNVAISFADEKSPRELRRLVRRHFQRLGANLLCSAKLMRMSPDKILQRVKIENIESMASRFRAGVPTCATGWPSSLRRVRPVRHWALRDRPEAGEVCVGLSRRA